MLNFLIRGLPLTEHLITQIHQYMLSKAPPVINEVHWNANAGPLRVSFSAGLIISRRVNTNHIEQLQRPEARAGRVVGDRFFTWTAIGLAISIVVLVLKKFIKASGSEASWMDEL